jgi:hypothetical protein
MTTKALECSRARFGLMNALDGHPGRAQLKHKSAKKYLSELNRSHHVNL